MKFQIQSRERYCRVPLKFIVRRWRTLSPDKGCSGRTKRPPLVWSLLLCCAALRPRIFYFHDTSESVLSIYLSINVQMCYVLQMLLLLLPCHRANCIVQRTWFEQLRFVYCLWNIKLSETRLLIKTRSGWPASLSTCVVYFQLELLFDLLVATATAVYSSSYLLLSSSVNKKTSVPYIETFYFPVKHKHFLGMRWMELCSPSRTTRVDPDPEKKASKEFASYQMEWRHESRNECSLE